MRKKTFFITFEGIEGAGKTSQIHLLKNYLKKKGLKVLVTKEPGGTFIADKIRKLLLTKSNEKLSPLTELLLFMASRAQHSNVLKKYLNQNYVIICDRFTDSSIAYQGFGRDLNLSFIDKLNKISTKNLKPDITFIIDLPENIGIKRAMIRMLNQTKNREDRFEEEKRLFHKKVRIGYITLAKKFPDRIKIIDGTKTKKQVFNEIKKHIDKMIK